AASIARRGGTGPLPAGVRSRPPRLRRTRPHRRRRASPGAADEEPARARRLPGRRLHRRSLDRRDEKRRGPSHRQTADRAEQADADRVDRRRQRPPALPRAGREVTHRRPPEKREIIPTMRTTLVAMLLFAAAPTAT